MNSAKYLADACLIWLACFNLTLNVEITKHVAMERILPITYLNSTSLFIVFLEDFIEGKAYIINLNAPKMSSNGTWPVSRDEDRWDRLQPDIL